MITIGTIVLCLMPTGEHKIAKVLGVGPRLAAIQTSTGKAYVWIHQCTVVK